MAKSILKVSALIAFISISINQNIHSQVFSQRQGCVTGPDGNCVSNTNLTAMPFLRITPDARGGGMGDAGIALDATSSSMHYNASALAFAEKDAVMTASYTPWLASLGLNDVYLAHLTGYKKLDDLQTIGFGLKYFNLGSINFRGPNGEDEGDGKPREFEASFGYARKLGDNLSASVTGKYLFSALAPTTQVNGIEITNATSFAADIGVTYKKKVTLGGYKGNMTLGAAMTNFGAKVTYTRDAIRDFIPTNLGIGGALTLNIDNYNSFTFTMDVNKLMVPTAVSQFIEDSDGKRTTNPDFSKDGDDKGDYRQKTLFQGVFGSFADAQGGLKEELQELNYSFGVEYWYDKQFAARAGYFYEHPLKGARKYYTLGAGFKFNVFQLDISYLIPGAQLVSPLDNTLRFTAMFDLGNLSAFDE